LFPHPTPERGITIDGADTIFEKQKEPAMHLFESNTKVAIPKRTGG
jgi:hypothetical protein